MKRRCPNCKKWIDKICIICPLCHKTIIECPNCKLRNKMGTKFCVRCEMNLITGKYPPSFWKRLIKRRLDWKHVLGVSIYLYILSIPFIDLVLKIQSIIIALLITFGVYLMSGTLFPVFFMEKSIKNIRNFLAFFIGFGVFFVVGVVVNILGGFYDKIKVQGPAQGAVFLYPGTYIGAIFGALIGWIVYRLSLRYIGKRIEKKEDE